MILGFLSRLAYNSGFLCKFVQTNRTRHQGDGCQSPWWRMLSTLVATPRHFGANSAEAANHRIQT